MNEQNILIWLVVLGIMFPVAIAAVHLAGTLIGLKFGNLEPMEIDDE